jgi:hypothetical protein
MPLLRKTLQFKTARSIPEQTIRIISISYSPRISQRLLAQAAPIILLMIGIIHKQRKISICQRSIRNKSQHSIPHTRKQRLDSAIHLVIRQCARERIIEFHENRSSESSRAIKSPPLACAFWASRLGIGWRAMVAVRPGTSLLAIVRP